MYTSISVPTVGHWHVTDYTQSSGVYLMPDFTYCTVTYCTAYYFHDDSPANGYHGYYRNVKMRPLQ